MSMCDHCQEREADAVAISEPETHPELLADGVLGPDPYSCRLLCEECRASNVWHVVHRLDDLAQRTRIDSVIARAAAYAAGVAIGLGLLIGAGDLAPRFAGTAVAVTPTSVHPHPDTAVAERLRRQLRTERQAAQRAISKSRARTVRLTRQLRRERRVGKANTAYVDHRRRWDSAVSLGASVVAWARGDEAGRQFAVNVRHVASCEAGNGTPRGLPQFTVRNRENGIAGGAMQYMPGTWSGTVLARFGMSRDDPHAAVVAAALHRIKGGRWSGPWLASQDCHGRR